MVHIPYEMIMEKLESETGMSRDQLEKKVQGKMKELSGLLSPEGAAHIIANELGVDVLPSVDKPVQVSKILDGMRNLTVIVKVLQKYEVREFERDGNKGRVMSIMGGDETGRIRITFWHDAVDTVRDVPLDSILRIQDCYARTNQGRIELSTTSSTKIVRDPEGVSISSVPDAQGAEPARCFIKDAASGAFVTLVGTLVQIFRPTFFEVCPECGKRIREKEGKYRCDQHGEVTPAYSYVLNAILDDGTDTIRLVLFRERVSEFFGIQDEEFQGFRERPDDFEELRKKQLGMYLKVSGRVSRNDMFGRVEIIANKIADVDPEKEIAYLNRITAE